MTEYIAGIIVGFGLGVCLTFLTIAYYYDLCFTSLDKKEKR